MPVTEGIQDINEDPLQELTSLLNAPILSRAECLSASSYLNEDENLETGGLHTDDDILAMVEGGCENDDDSDNDDNDPEEDRTPPTSQQAKVLQYYFDSENDEEGCWAVVGIQTSNSSLKTRGAAAPALELLGVFGLEEPLLKLLCSAELQCTNSSQISNCQHSKSAIFISRNINSNINSLLRLRVGTHIYIYIYVYISDERYIPEVEMKTMKTKQ